MVLLEVVSEFLFDKGFDVDNLDSHSQGSFSQNGFHGKAISVTNHKLSWDNLGVKYSCVRLDSKNISVP